MASSEKQFNLLWGIEPRQRSKPQKTPRMDLTTYDKLVVDTSCLLSSVGSPCLHQPVSPQMAVTQLELAKRGIPHRYRPHSSLVVPLCDLCKYMWWWLRLGYSCKSTWVSLVRKQLHVGTKEVRSMLPAWEAAAKLVIDEVVDNADEYLSTLALNTTIITVQYGDVIDVEGELVWVDITKASTEGIVFSLWHE